MSWWGCWRGDLRRGRVGDEEGIGIGESYRDRCLEVGKYGRIGVVSIYR